MKKKIYFETDEEQKAQRASITIVEPDNYRNSFKVRLQLGGPIPDLSASEEYGSVRSLITTAFGSTLSDRGSNYVEVALNISAVISILDELHRLRNGILGLDEDDDDDDGF